MANEAQIVLALLAVFLLCVPLLIFWKARRNGGVAELPSMMMFGWGGAAWGQTCIVIDRDTWKRGTLVCWRCNYTDACKQCPGDRVAGLER